MSIVLVLLDVHIVPLGSVGFLVLYVYYYPYQGIMPWAILLSSD